MEGTGLCALLLSLFICSVLCATNNNPNGGCELYNQSATPTLAKICPPYLAKEVFVPNIPDAQAYIDQNMGPQFGLIIASHPILPIICYQRISSLLCQAVLPTCMRNETYHYILPHCHSLCYETAQMCGDFFGNASVANYVLGCDAANPQTGEPVYPETGCSNLITPQDSYEPFSMPQAKCPTVLGLKKNPALSDPPCTYKCPDESFEQVQYDYLNKILLSFGSLSFVLMITMFTSQALIPERREFPACTQMWIAFGLIIQEIGYFLNGIHPKTNGTWCHDAGTYATQETSARCTMQGILILWGGLFGLAWTCILSYNLFYSLVIHQMKGGISNLKKNAVYFHIITWTIPTVLTIAALAKKTMAFGSGGLPFCFIASEVINGVTIDIALFFAEEAILIGLSLVMLICSIARIWVVHKSVSRAASSSSLTVEAIRRVVIFVLILCSIGVIVLQWRFRVQSEGLPNVRAKVMSWTQCQVKTQLGLPDPGECPGDRTPMVVGYGLVVALTFLNGALGIMLFCSFGISKDNYQAWPVIYKYAREGNWRSAWQYVAKKNFSGDRSKSSSGPKATKPNSVGIMVSSSKSSGDSSRSSNDLELSSSNS